MSSNRTSPDCLICSLEQGPDTTRVFRDEFWAAEVAPGYEVPGWFFLRARRHTELITGLDDRELRTLGVRARDLTEAVAEVTGSEAVYFMSFGENYRHYHALITARSATVPAELRGGRIVGMLPREVDREASLRLVQPVSEAYARIVETRRAQP